ncbi:MAG: acyl-[ACP]--phospholipid O-acyltransferase, partial [Acidobacteria bacterium]
AVLGNTYFWFLAALLQTNILFYSDDFLHAGPVRKGYLQAALAIGIGVGSLAAGYLSGKKIEYGLIPVGSIGLTAFALALFGNGLGFGTVAGLLGMLGFFAGFFVVPINALIQHRPDPDRKGGVIAAANLLSFAGIFLGSAVYYLFVMVHLDARHIFLASAFITVAGTIYVLVLLPESLMRLLLWFLVHSIYRIRIEGRGNIPAKGGALFVSNHLSFIDALLLMASTERHVRFLMYKKYYDHPLIHPFAAIIGAIPISAELRPREMIRSLRTANETIKSGHVVCIFAEGQITRIGQLLPFRRGLERIIKGTDAPIVPVNLDGIWGSVFSYEKGRFLWKLPKDILHPITVSYGAHMPSTSTAFEVREAVQELASNAYKHRKLRMKTLPRAFVRAARRHPFRFAMADASSALGFASALTRTVFLARRLKPVWQDQEMVGILLPPSIAGALVNFAALLMGKIPVNLNYTLSNEGIASCARQCQLQTVVTSKAFLERVRIDVPGRVVLLEELAAGSNLDDKWIALLMAWTFPVRLLERAVGGKRKIQLDDVATIIFSSGSTGDPKGVMLTHYNIGSNIEQLDQCFAFKRRDRVLGVLPFFHSFGFTGTMALPMVTGTGVVYHPSPLDAQAIGVLVEHRAVTFLLATPTFLQAYMRRCNPEDFGSVQFVLVGAEKLHERTAQAFEDKFGIRPLEAYGCTECAPAVTVNTRDYRAAGFRQVGGKRGKIGHALPGVSVRIVDPESFEPRSVGQSGLLLVRGPNVMKGYLNRPDKTAEVLRDGWYITGDIATLDQDGFLEITDRLTRFSKIAGEMVPHIRVEEKLQELADMNEQVFAVTTGPDEKKGERLLVLHTLPEGQLKSCIEKLGQIDLPNLWIPRPNAFFRVDALPHLGSGKLDLRKIRDLALQLSRGLQASLS